MLLMVRVEEQETFLADLEKSTIVGGDDVELQQHAVRLQCLWTASCVLEEMGKENLKQEVAR